MAKEKVSFTLDSKIMKIIDEEAGRRNTSRSDAVEKLIEYHDPESCILKKDFVPILQNISTIVDEDEGKGLKERDLRKIRKVISNLWDLI